MGLTNVKVIVPFVRTVGELQEVLEIMRSQTLAPERDSGLETWLFLAREGEVEGRAA